MLLKRILGLFFFELHDKCIKIKSSETIEIHYQQLIKCLSFFKEFLEIHGIKTLRKYLKSVREDSLQFFLQGILSSHFQTYREVPRGDGIIDFFIIGPEGINIVIKTKMSDNENYLDGIKNQSYLLEIFYLITKTTILMVYCGLYL